MKQIIKLFLVLLLSTIVNASNNWVPIIMGDIVTFVPSAKPTLTSYKANYNIGESAWIQIHNKRDIHAHPKDWIGIYPKNSNNSWENQLGWTWVQNESPTQSGEHDWYKFDGLDAGDYEARLFFDNTFHLEAKTAFRVTETGNGRKFGTEGPYLNNVKSVKTSENGKVNNAIYYVEGVDNLPTVIFMSGWKSNLQSYDGFLTYVASLGYCVIAKQERGKCFTPSIYNQELTDRLNMVHNTYNADISKLGIIGHSSGGGIVHYLMNYLKGNNIAGNIKSVVISLDGWFPFGTTEAMLNAFDTPTLLMQFGGNDGINHEGIHPDEDWDDYSGEPYHHYQDPKINLAIFQSLTQANVDKEYIVLEANNEHSYFEGNYDSLIPKIDFLAPVDEFLNHTIGTGVPMNLINQYNDVITNDLASEYRFYCHLGGYNFCDLNHLIFP